MAATRAKALRVLQKHKAKQKPACQPSAASISTRIGLDLASREMLEQEILPRVAEWHNLVAQVTFDIPQKPRAGVDLVVVVKQRLERWVCECQQHFEYRMRDFEEEVGEEPLTKPVQEDVLKRYAPCMAEHVCLAPAACRGWWALYLAQAMQQLQHTQTDMEMPRDLPELLVVGACLATWFESRARHTGNLVELRYSRLAQ